MVYQYCHGHFEGSTTCRLDLNPFEEWVLSNHNGAMTHVLIRFWPWDGKARSAASEAALRQGSMQGHRKRCLWAGRYFQISGWSSKIAGWSLKSIYTGQLEQKSNNRLAWTIYNGSQSRQVAKLIGKDSYEFGDISREIARSQRVWTISHLHFKKLQLLPSLSCCLLALSIFFWDFEQCNLDCWNAQVSLNARCTIEQESQGGWCRWGGLSNIRVIKAIDVLCRLVDS